MDAIAQPEELVQAAASMGMPALALTEHRTLASAMRLCLAAKQAGIKPIYGVEIDETDRRDEHLTQKQRKEQGIRDYHLTLLARNAQGVRNLFALGSEAALSGSKPRTELSIIRKNGWGAGIIALTGCQGSRFSALVRQDFEAAKAWFDALRETFDEVYVEVQAHTANGQPEHNARALGFASAYGLPVVVTRDVHYARQEDGPIHDKWVAVQKRGPYGPYDFFLASADQMRQDCEKLGIPLEAMAQVMAIAERIEAVDLTSAPMLPRIELVEGESPEDALTRLAYQGYFDLEPAKRTPRYRRRLEHELDVICSKGFASYFLILYDMLRWARENGIPVGPGRGSAAGSLVSYLLGITRVDPIENGLLFERFLNPERTSLPDIDVDVDAERRSEVLAYLQSRYGTSRVAQVGNYGTEHVRSAIKDAMRLLNFSFDQANRISQRFPSKWPDQTDVHFRDLVPILSGVVPDAIAAYGPAVVDQVRQAMAALVEAARTEPALIRLVERFEGLIRSYGVHAGGVVVAPVDVVERSPLRLGAGKAVLPVTQWDLHDVEAAGLLKLDVLGLKTLSVIRIASELSGVDPNQVDLNDPELYRDLGEGHTHGLFQAEGGAVRQIGVQMKPRTFSEVVDLLALARPGPMDARLQDGRTMVEHYLDARKSGRFTAPHRSLRKVLASTWGVMVYQEQIMEIGRIMAGYSLGEADLLRRAIGKKKHDEMQRLRAEFVERSVARGYDRAFCERLFSEIEKFAAYAFNRSHSAAYAYLLAQTLYLKRQAPAAYVAAMLTVDAGDSDKVAEHLTEAKRLGIRLLPPDIHASDVGFTVEGDAIRYGLGAVYGIGKQAAQALIEGRPYRDLEDLLSRKFDRKVTVRHLLNLAMAGAFDSMGVDRGEVVRTINARRTKPASLPKVIDRRRWLEWERELLGAYISGHPADDLPQPDRLVVGERIEIGGLVRSIRRHLDRRSKEMAFITLDTPSGVFDVIAFSTVWRPLKHRTRLRALVVEGRLEPGGRIVADSLVDPSKKAASE